MVSSEEHDDNNIQLQQMIKKSKEKTFSIKTKLLHSPTIHLILVTVKSFLPEVGMITFQDLLEDLLILRNEHIVLGFFMYNNLFC